MSDEREYFIYDYETGYPTPVSKEIWEAYNAWMSRMWDQAMPKDEYKGVALLYGTGGGLEGGTELQNLFTQTENYGYVAGVDPYAKEGEPQGMAYFIPYYDSHLDKFGNPKEDNI